MEFNYKLKNGNNALDELKQEKEINQSICYLFGANKKMKDSIERIENAFSSGDFEKVIMHLSFLEDSTKFLMHAIKLLMPVMIEHKDEIEADKKKVNQERSVEE